MKLLKRTIPSLLLAAVLFLLATPAQSGFWDRMKSILNQKEEASRPTPSRGEVTQGLKEALEIGTRRAVQEASREGGFTDNPLIRIPIPPRFQKVAGLLERLGYKDQVDAFKASMNRAAEKASAEAAPIFIRAIKEMSFQDAMKIWKGGDTAATQYFQEKTQKPLYEAFRPVVHRAMGETGVTQRYEELVGMPRVKTMAGLMGANLDLDDYVTNGALKGLFTLLGREERKIRKDPTARTTELLKRLFGSN